MVSSCGGHTFELSDVPIVGGTEEVRLVVRDELRAFEGWIGSGRLHISSVEIRKMSSTALGHFDRLTKRVVLKEDNSPVLARLILRHELCHALDFAEDLGQVEPTLLDRLADGLYSGVSGSIAVDSKHGHRVDRSEAIARFCELGPFAAQVLSQPCPSEAADVGAISEWMARYVWTEFVIPGPSPMGPARAEWRVDETPSILSVHPTAESQVILIQWGGPSALYSAYVDIYSGAEITDRSPESSPDEVTPQGPPGESVFHGVGLTDGAALGVIQYSLHHLGPSWPRLIVADTDEEWALVDDGCTSSSEGTTTFVADEQVWVASWQGDVIWWNDVQPQVDR